MKRAIFLGLGVAAGLGSVACQNVTGLSDLQFAQEPAPDGQGGSGGEPGGSGGQGGSGGSGQGGAGQAGSSVGGAGTGGSGGGAAGGGAGGSAGGGNCDQNQAPLVVLAATIQGSAGQEILLDASASSDPEQGTLSFSWEPLNGAPSLMDASSASPSLLVQECGDYSYKVTVSDACGASSEATVKVQVNTGGYVAKNACNSATACGGKSSPWCEIQEAVDSTQGALTIRVAGGQYAPVVLRAGVSLEGGYDDQFQARSTALDNLGTSIPLVEGSAIQGPLTGEAVVDGILITAGLTAPLPSLDAILLREQGALTLRNLKVVGGSPGQNVSKICAVARGSQGSGALVLGPGVEITALDALDTSAALCLEGTGDVTLTDVVLSGGTSNESLAIDASFSGTLQISGGSILGGPGVAYAAALRWHVTPPAPGAKLLVDGTTLRGGSGSKTVGLDLLGLGHAFLKNGVVSGEDPASGGGLETVGIGLLASEVGEGLEPGVVLENSSIEGASAAQERTGILLDRSGLSATGGTIDGSTTPGGRRVIGLCSKGLTAGSGGISLKGLERVAGGAPDGAGQKYEAFGVELLSPTGATITGNKLITGCSSACKANAPASVAAAVHATQGNHSIEKNDALVGGPQSGGVAASLARHSGVFLELGCGEEKCAKFTISDNKAIVGNLAPAETPGIAVGIDGKGVQIIAKGNRIVGGYGAAQVTGLLMDQNKLSEVILNTIGGGVGKTAVGAFTSSQSSLLFTRNAVNACGVPLDGPEDDGCKLGDKSTGLISHNDSNSRISNNYALGGFGLVASGCELGNNPDLTPSPAQFVYNLCLGIGRAGSSKAVGIQLLGLSGKGAAGLVVRNNIFLTANLATELYAGAEETVSSLTLTHNDFFLLDNPALGAGRALYKRNSSEFDATSQINVSSANVNSNSNVSLNPGFVAPTLNFSALTAADLHLKNDSSLKAKGVSISNELIDFDGEPRNNPEIGPDELP